MVAFVVPKHKSYCDVVEGFSFRFCYTATSSWDYNAKLKFKLLK